MIRILKAQVVLAVLLFGILLLSQVALHAAAPEEPVRNFSLTPRRIGAIASVVVALIGATAGALALAQGAHRNASNRVARRRPLLAIILAPIGFIGGTLVVATAKGGLGTGNGLGGGVVAMVIGLIGLTLGALASGTSRRAQQL